jgi:hypothetical protein
MKGAGQMQNAVIFVGTFLVIAVLVGLMVVKDIKKIS